MQLIQWKGVIIIGIILISLFLVYQFFKYLRIIIKPEINWGRFLLWLLASLSLVFVSTFVIVFIVKLIFPIA
ncbi:MAG: hypothetical protein V9F46_07905 [Chitinophagaceae bacterium]